MNSSKATTAAIITLVLFFIAFALFWFDVGLAEARERERCEAEGISNRYDDVLKTAARRYMEEPLRSRWCLVKAICWTESRLDPDAESGAGAVGLCQITEPTAETARRITPIRSRNLRDAKANAAYAAATLQRNWNIWISPRTPECRWELTAASYNAGAGHIINAQKLAAGALCWERIRRYLPEVTGKHAWETIDYISRVEKTYRRLRGFEF